VSELSRVPLRPPLQAAIHGAGRYHTASDVGDLAAILMTRRPSEQDETWRHAVVACLEALEAQSGEDLARKAFVEACRDAGISVLPGDATQH
jgi:hypothetical protein